MVIFGLSPAQEALQFTYAFDGGEIVLEDDEGNEWNCIWRGS